ncbi:HMG domain-containing protein 3 [Chelonia mydas]|uniref:HMG domain-containing protein 3 n=1 Tax=Chelonia mydas TaxID=8469 RepID=M7AI53_CHEMY|nr:HMG domain-containing protein 3 [Chelonia mydas]
MEAQYDGTEVTVVMEEIEGTYTYASPVPSKKKKKYRSPGDQGERAKKPRSAYLLYYYDIYLKVQQELPHLPQSEINKKISESWRLLSVAEKSYYLEKAKLEKEGLDPNSKLSTLTAVVPDIPGFRKILPRSDYIIIPKTTLQEDRSRQHLELCVAQGQTASEGETASTNITSVPHDSMQNILSVDSSHVGISEQCIAIEGLTEETASFGQSDTIEEVVASEILSHYVRPIADKMTGDILLDEASLEIGEGHPYQTTSVVIEETLVSSCRDISNGSIAVAQPQVSDGLSVVTVVTGRDTDESCSSMPTTQFIMLPLPAHSVVENPTAIKLEKQPKGKAEQSSGVPLKAPGAKRSQQPVATEKAPAREDATKSTLESSEAVSQLLNAVPIQEQIQETEWEEVIISEAHILANRGNAAAATLAKESDAQGNSSLEQPEKDSIGIGSQPSAEMTSPLASPTATVKKPMGIDALAAAPKGQELKSKPKPKPSLLAAARPMRAILPAPASLGREARTEQLSSRQGFPSNDKHSPVRTSGLKSSTLKQLGQSVLQPSSISERKLHSSPASRASQVKVVEVKPDVFPSYKYSCTVTLEVSSGLPDVLNTSEPLTQSQKEIQRQSTLQLLRKVMQIPENESELAEVFALIHELNSSRLILSNVSEETVTIEQTSWSNYYESPSTQCLLCNSPLFKGGQNSLAGPQECWLLTANRLQVVTSQVKVCLNLQCLALHSFMDIYTGLFNVGNKLLVSLDLLFTVRNHIKLGEDPKVAVGSILESVQEQTEKTLSPEELSQLQELLCNGYWAFECLTVRDYNDMICGVCGIAPKIEIAQRNAENVLALKNVEFTWPEFLSSSEVNVEDFWSTMETEVIEQVAFPSSIPITKFDASIVAPFFPPLMRGAVVVNTEKDKNLDAHPVPGSGSALVRLLQEESCKLEQINSYSEEELQYFLTQCSIPWGAADTKDQLCYSLLALYDFVQNGADAKQPPVHHTGGKIYKVCPHQCVSCPELLDQHYSVDMTVAEHSVQHPVTKSTARRIVHTGAEQNSQSGPTARHRSISLCQELEPYSAIITAINDSKISSVRQRPITFDNATHYYLYNRLMDFFTSREIVNRQIHEIVQSCQPGEVVIRDTLYRLGVAQIKTETEEEEEENQEDDGEVAE